MNDCRSENGQTVGLIDAMTHISRELARKGLWDQEVKEALADLWSDECFQFVCSQANCAFDEWRTND